jgi:hypothetical protein
MGFSGGSANVTKAHQHDGAVVQDGGSLAANATQFGLTNGSMLYSDGTNIQEIGVGASGYVLGTAAGTIPTWEASAASIVMSVNGQMVYFDGSRTALDIGSTADILTVSAGGLPEWTAPGTSGAQFNFLDVQNPATFNTTSTSFVLVTGNTLSLTQTTGKSLCTVMGAHQSNVAGHYCDMELTLDGTQIEHAVRFSSDLPINSTHPHCLQFWVTSDTVDVDFNLMTGNSLATATIHAMGSLDIMEIY